MNRFLLPFAFGFLILRFETKAQDFIRFFQDTAESQVATDLEMTPSGFWLGGNRLRNGEDQFSIWIYRLDRQAQVLKRFRISSPRPQNMVGMKSLNETKLAFVYSEQSVSGNNEYFLGLADTNQFLQIQSIPQLSGSVLDDVSLTRNGDLLVCGFKAYPGIQGNDFILARIKPEPLQVKWIFEDGLTSNDHIKAAQEASNGDILFNGDVFQSTYNPVVGRLDSNGITNWITPISTVWNDGSQRLTEGPDGRIWMVGESSTAAGPAFDAELTTISPEGTVLWQQWLGSGGQDAAFHIENQATSGFWVAGYSNAGSAGVGPVSPFLMKLDSEGQSLGEKFWPQSSPTLVYDFINQSDTLFVFAGISLSMAFILQSIEPDLNPVFVVGSPKIREKRKNIRVSNPYWEMENPEKWEYAIWYNAEGRILWQGKPELINNVPASTLPGCSWIRLQNESGSYVQQVFLTSPK